MDIYANFKLKKHVAPFIFSFYYALIDNTFNKKFVGLGNFIRVLSNKYYRLALKNTFRFTGIAVPLVVLISFLLAVLLASQHKISHVFRTSFIIPILIPSASVVMIWKAIFGKNNFLVEALSSIFTLGDNLLYEFPVLMFFLWKNTGLNVILFLAGLMSIPREIYESCDVEGARWFQKHFYVTFPLLLPTTFFTLIISTVNSFKIFKEVYLLYGSYPSEVIYFVQHYMNNHFNKLNYQNLTTGAIIFALIVYIIVALGYRLENRFSRGVWN